MKNSKRYLAAAAATVLLFAGCSSGKKNTANEIDVTKAKYGSEYPIQTDETLKIWSVRKPHPEYLKIEDQPAYKETAKRTGITAEYAYPSGDATEQFNLLIASGEYPDIIIYNWLTGYGSPAKAIGDKVIRPLNDIIDAYAPNLSGLLKENEERAKYLKTDDGQYYVFPTLGGENAINFLGPIVNKTLLDENGIAIPETIDEWTQMLRTLKENGVESPLALRGSHLSNDQFSAFIFGAFNTAFNYYRDSNGDVKYGPLEPEFKDALLLLKSWYDEELLDKEFVSCDDTLVGQKMVDGRSAVTDYFLSRILSWKDSAAAAGKNYTYAAMPYPSAVKGEKPEFGYRPPVYNVGPEYEGAAITTQCENVELAAKYLDYWYTKEGGLLCNFGIEGETYEMKDGAPKLLEPYASDFDLIVPYMKDYVGYGYEYGQMMAEQRYTLQEQKDASAIWETNMAAHTLPPIQSTAEEEDIVNKLINDVSSYADEMVLKFIVGYESLDNYDKFVEELKKKGIEEILEVKRAQIERFNNR